MERGTWRFIHSLFKFREVSKFKVTVYYYLVNFISGIFGEMGILYISKFLILKQFLLNYD